MASHVDSRLANAIAASALPLEGSAYDYDPLLELVGDARFVLLGEASHGSHEFYRERARITQRLITELGFGAVAVEADWPDAYRVNRYVRGQGADRSSEAALAGFKRFPTWMWRNAEVLEFLDWLHDWNRRLPPSQARTGFYGLDLYSLFTSITEVLRYLEQVDPHAAQQARARYACFDHYGGDSQRYGYGASLNLSASCEDAVVAQLRQMQGRAFDYVRQEVADGAEAYFHAQQNARLVMHAEEYYRTMFRGRVSSWNLRDRHMADTLEALSQHLSHGGGKPARIVVWEHNSHIGDARATDMGEHGEWTLGQLAREAYADEAVLVGFTTHHGTVTAASDWDAPAERKRVRPALAGSIEDAFHHSGVPRFLLPLRTAKAAAQALAGRRLERAIGVIYRPQTERHSHYLYARLPQQFDAVLHFDETHAVQPLEASAGWHAGEAPETFPEGI
ncbi:erythromycin esterase family protein [Janthinobacterium sp. 17J80-10]|uniref:erythromycin esterase family protein n=1 Tax=Janthinobacterium sp. 17J80-10 TaxID=2497863 RepID=UPI0010053891|nr:erythromycin esterase family protein [Janthinobacterium sp. 17J80-10]QAU34753.1 erythromycin esterase family protein [Janthinobacterium sp. 17J80-10]